MYTDNLRWKLNDMIWELNIQPGIRPSKINWVHTIHSTLLDLQITCRRKIMFAIDSISAKYFINHPLRLIDWNPKIDILTSTFPSTSNVAWTSIITGDIPSNNWIVWVSYKLAEWSYVWLSDSISKIDWKSVASEIELEDAYKDVGKTIFQKLPWKHTYYWKHGEARNWINSRLHQVISRGATLIRPGTQGDDYYNIDKIITDVSEHLSWIPDANIPWLDWVYIDLDNYIHRFGYDGRINEFFEKLFAIIDRYKGMWYEILLCSDHWQIDQWIVETNIFEKSKESNLFEIMTSWAGRTLFFYPKCWKEKAALKWVKNIVWDTWVILDKNGVIDLWFFDNTELVSERVWSIIAIATWPWFPSTWIWNTHEHWSISPEEMLVPFVKFD